MATKTVRTPTKVRANREAVLEYFNAMKQEPVKDGSTLQQTPSGLHFKIPTKRLVYESDHYAVFDVEESASSQSDDASFQSLRGQESIDAPQGFYYGTENESQRYHGGQEHQQKASSSGLQDRRYTNSCSQRSTTSGKRDSTFTAQQDSRHSRMSGTSQTYHYTGGEHGKSTGSICPPNEKLRSGHAGMQHQASTIVEQSKVDGGQHRTTTSRHSQRGWQSAQHGSQHSTQYNQKQGGVSGTADLCHLYGYVDDKRAERNGEEAKYEEDILRKGFEEMMKEAVSSTKEINQFLYDLWRTQRMCDITIKVNEKEFHAHKLALAAHSEKFTNRYCEEAPSTITEVILPDATPEATEALINYIYTNELTLTAENIESIIVCARQLGIKSALNFCQDFLNSFNEDSVLFLLPIAQRQGFTEVAERMFGFINKSSLVMLQSVGFLQCEVHQVEWMISRDELVVSTELEVFMAVLRWINHDQTDRIKYAPMLIGCVRLIYISPEELVKHVEPETHIFNIQKCFEMLYFAFRYHAIKLSGSTMYTIMKVPPPRRYTVPVSEQSQIADRRISEKPGGPTNKTNNMSCPALHYSYASTGSEIRRDFPGGRNVAVENSKLLSACSGDNRRNSGSPVKAGILRPTGQSFCVSARESSASKQGILREWSSGYCTEDAQQRVNQTGSQALESSPEGESAGHVQSQNSPQNSRGDRNGSMGPKRLSFSEALPINTDDTRGYKQLGRGQESRDAEPSRDSEQDSDKTSTVSDSSGSAKMPKPRRVVNKMHQASPETEKPFERTKVPKTRTRNKPLSHDRFLVIGGIDPFEVTDYQTSRLVEEYFPGKSEWTAKTSLPDSRHHTCACLLDGFIYLVGGSTYSQEKPDNLANPTSTCFRYDPDKDNWSRISSLQTPRMYHGAGVLDGVVYAVGGHDYTGRALDTVEYYNADTDSWSYAANMTEPKLGVACIGYKGHLYVMGGSIDRGGKKVVLKTVECYDPKLNCWVRKRSLPRPLCHACVLEVNNYLFLLGGATQSEPGGDMESSNVVYRYSRLSEVWTEFTEMITPRHDAGAVAVGCNIYVVGGICTQTGEAVDTMEVLDCETATWEEENEEEFRPVIGVACVLMPRL